MKRSDLEGDKKKSVFQKFPNSPFPGQREAAGDRGKQRAISLWGLDESSQSVGFTKTLKKSPSKSEQGSNLAGLSTVAVRFFFERRFLAFLGSST